MPSILHQGSIPWLVIKPKKLAIVNGKRVLVDYDTKPRQEYDRQYNRKRAFTDSEYLMFYHSTEWKHTREEVLLRDDYLCVRCGSKGKLVDHIVPSKLNWDERLNQDNLESLCKECHKAKTKREWLKANKGRQRAMNVNIVAGYPGSGKSKYVYSHLTEHDLVYDYDQLMHVLTGLPLYEHNEDVHEYIQMFFELIIRRLKGETTFNNVWIITTFPDERLDNLLITYGLNVNHYRLDTTKAESRENLLREHRDEVIDLLNEIDKKDFSKFKILKTKKEKN